MQTTLTRQATEAAKNQVTRMRQYIVKDDPRGPTAKDCFEKANRFMELALDWGKLGVEAYSHQFSTINEDLERSLLGVIRKNLYRDMPVSHKGRGRRSKFSQEQRREIISIKSVTQACKKYGISPPTFYKWKKELVQ